MAKGKTLSKQHREAISRGMKKKKSDSKKKKAAVKGVWFEGRRTAIVVDATSRSEAISKAKAKKKRGGEKVAGVRNLKGSELSQAQKGRWVRSGLKGEKPGYGEKRGYGPPSKKYLEEQRSKKKK